MPERITEAELDRRLGIVNYGDAEPTPANGHRFEMEEGPWDDGAPAAAGPEDFGLPSVGEADPPSAVARNPVTLVSAGDWPDEPPPPVSWVVRNKIPRGDVSTLDGDGGLGKTMAAIQLASAAARGSSDWLGFEVVDAGPVLFLSAEEPEAEVRRRTYRVAERGKFPLSELRNLHFWFPPDVGDCLLAAQSKANFVEATPLFRSIVEHVEQLRPVLVVVDHVAAIYGGDQNHRGMVRGFMNLWRGLARSSGAAILLLNHPSLSGLTTGTGRGGSMDWRNSVRAGLHIKPAEDRADADRGVRVLECVKNNYAPPGSPVRLEWVDGLLTVEGTASPIQRAAQDAQADEKFLELLGRFTRLGIDVGPSTGQNYAPKVFAEASDSGGYTSRGFATIMHRLLHHGRVQIEEHGPPSKRRKRLVIAGQGRTE